LLNRVSMPRRLPSLLAQLPIGRIMKTMGYPNRDAKWLWVISLPRESGDGGIGDNLADCEAGARVAADTGSGAKGR